VADAGQSAASGYNVVIHEFAHKLDLRDGALDGCPPLSGRARRQAWQACMQHNYDEFCRQVNAASRFAGLVEPVWLDDYAAESLAEFFAVTLEAYFVARETFALHHGELLGLYDSFFRPGQH
jgi:Mlc titration factor MtfA (ptsG expression regulator)